MTAVIDATTLLLFLNPEAKPPLKPGLDEELPFAKERVDYLIATLEQDGTKIIIPTPALSEILVRSEDAAPEYLAILNHSSRFKIVDFDQIAAIELAALNREAIAAGGKKDGSDQPWQKIKFDRQILAIARVARADTIYSDDKNLMKFGKKLGFKIVQTHELPLPPDNPQGNMDV